MIDLTSYDRLMWHEINTFFQQGCIKLIKSDSKDISNVTKDSYFK